MIAVELPPQLSDESEQVREIGTRILTGSLDSLTYRLADVNRLPLKSGVKDFLVSAINERVTQDLAERISRIDPDYLQYRLLEVNSKSRDGLLTADQAQTLIHQINERAAQDLTKRISTIDPDYLEYRLSEVNSKSRDGLLTADQAQTLIHQINERAAQDLANRISKAGLDYLQYRELDVQNQSAAGLITSEQADQLRKMIEQKKSGQSVSMPTQASPFTPRPVPIPPPMPEFKPTPSPLPRVEPQPEPIKEPQPALAKEPVEEVVSEPAKDMINSPPPPVRQPEVVKREVTSTESESYFIATFTAFSREADALETDFQKVSRTELTDAQHLDFYRRAADILRRVHNELRSVKDFKLLNQAVPNRFEIIVQLQKIVYTCLDTFPLTQLTATQQDAYIDALATQSRSYVNRDYKTNNLRDHGYYFFGMGRAFFEMPEWVQVRKKVLEHRETELTPREETIMQAEEDTVYKLHIQLTKEEWKPIIKMLMAARIHDAEIMDQLFDEKKAQGQERSVTNDEITNRGGKLADWTHWKIIVPDQQNDYMPSIVSYVMGAANQTEAIASLQKIVDDFAQLLKESGIQLSSTTTPRFSTEVQSPSGQKLPGVFYVNGDGDWKEYLQIHGKLDEVYDRTANYAHKPGQALTFALP